MGYFFSYGRPFLRIPRRQFDALAGKTMGTGIGQALEFMTALAKKVPWGNTDSGLIQRLILEIDRVGLEFNQFIANGGRCVPEALKAKAEPPPPPPWPPQ